MQRSSAELKPPTVVVKDGKNWKKHIGLFVDGTRYYLTDAEALSLADRLVDAVERKGVQVADGR